MIIYMKIIRINMKLWINIELSKVLKYTLTYKNPEMSPNHYKISFKNKISIIIVNKLKVLKT